MVELLGMLMKLAESFFSGFRWMARKLEDHYDGRLAGIPQILFVIGMAIIVFSPFWVYTGLLAMKLQPPYCYGAFILWIAYIGTIVLFGAYAVYTRGKSSIRGLSKNFKWDIEKYLEEYLEQLQEQEDKHRKKR